jgi:hypothetical protein
MFMEDEDEGANPNDYGTPLMYTIMREDLSSLRSVLSHPNAREWTDRSDSKLHITPLIAVAVHPDTQTVAMARLLMAHGARVDTPDDGPGTTPLWMAAQNGKPKLLAFLLEQGAAIDKTPRTSVSQPIWIAAQNGHAHCVAKLAQHAASEGRLNAIIESTNRQGRSPCYTAIEHGHIEVVGTLAQAGQDLRRVIPHHYMVGESFGGSDERKHTADPSPAFPIHYALEATVRSFVSATCAKCGKSSTNGEEPLKKCGRCRLAFFCGKECQTAVWKSHKKVCSKLDQGAKLYASGGAIPEPSNEPFGFEDGFFPIDDENECDDDDDYNHDDHPIWEYDAGRRGHPEWRRYPLRIEMSLESLAEMGSPKYMYRPGDLESEGKYERQITSPNPPRGVSTRHVTFCNMVEREVYTGAFRHVRRNKKRSSGHTCRAAY